jgi:type I restriction enzyme S subunit
MKNLPIEGHLVGDVYYRPMGSGTRFVNGDTLLARITPCLENGKTAFVDFLEEGEVGWGSTEYIVMRPREDLPECIAYFIARQNSFRVAAIQSMTGTSGRQRANAKTLAALSWVQYPKELLDRFDLFASSYLRLVRSRGEESKTLSELRDVLLPRLLSGEISVPEQEAADTIEA